MKKNLAKVLEVNEKFWHPLLKNALLCSVSGYGPELPVTLGTVTV